MTRTTYTCDGCGTRLDNQKDLLWEEGTKGPTWKCARCQTTVPGVIAERISHQRQRPRE
ncbi:MAG: hypothetical protein ABEI98_05405 [Halorhabdus sp.]